MTTSIDRRTLVTLGAGAALVSLLPSCGERGPARAAADARGEGKGAKKDEEEEVSPAEDLMREHGVLARVLLVYEESARRLETEGAPTPERALVASAGIVRRFVEDYHEKLEEDFLFPRFEKAGVLVDLVAVLRRQHVAGRRLTDEIQSLAPRAARDADARKKLTTAVHAFVRMYRPHAAREDTVLFTALPHVIGHEELERLGEHFEEEEHARFGRQGFESVVAQVASIERDLGIEDLDRFTPPAP